MSDGPARYDRLKELLLGARELDPAAREDFVRAEATDEAMAREILDLLAHDASPHELLDQAFVAAPALPERIGPYFIEEQIGVGGMGVVYRARQEEPIRRQVALKLIRGGFAPESVVRRFEQESRTLALMDHPHIATVLDAGSDEHGQPWFVMPLVEGLPLLEFCDEHRLAIDDRLRLFEEVCRAVHHAHGRGVLHRDLKPGNILVRQVSGRAVPVIIDFGIAKALEDDGSGPSLTREGQRIGTPAYMSPEQLDGDERLVDARSDVFALGIILYELLTGRHPHGEEAGRSPSTTDPPAPSTAVEEGDTSELAAHRGTTPRELRRHLRGDLDTICLMAVRIEPGRRYASAAHFADDLRRYREGHPVEARPDTWSYRTGKFIRRHPVSTALVAAALVAVIAGAAGLVWHAGRLQAERDRALVAEARAVRELETSRAVVDFFEELFKLARPDQGGRPDLGALEMLDLADERIEATGDEVWLQAALYRVLGSLNIGLSRYEEAERLLELSLERNAAIEGRAPGEVLYQRATILIDYGVVLHDLGHYPRAAEASAEAVRLFQQSGVADPISLALALNYLGVNLQANGQLAESVGPTERSLRLNEEHGPPDDPEVAWGWGSLGYINYQLGHHDVAVEQFEHALELARRVFDGDHYDLAHHLNNLGGVYHRIGRIAEAEPLLVEGLEMNQRMFATEPHGSLARAYMNLASLSLDLGRAAEAVELLDRGYEVSVAALGADHPRTARLLAARSLARQRAGDPKGALEDALRSAELAEAKHEPGHRDRAAAHLTRGRVLTLQGRHAEALGELEQHAAWVDANTPAGHPRRAESARWIGEARLGLRDRAEAAARFAFADSCYTASFGPDHHLAVEARELLRQTREMP